MKRISLLLALVFIGSITNICAQDAIHTIGEKYEGGVIFYLTPDGMHGIISETQDQGDDVGWGKPGMIVSNIGNPDSNSIEGKKYTDWRLPSYFELTQLYKYKDLIGGFSNNAYISFFSIHGLPNTVISFKNGKTGNPNSIGGKASMRLVRSF